MKTIQTGNITIELLRGDITHQEDIEAVVNAANAQLKTGGGVAGAIHRAAGMGLAEEAVPMGPIGPGEAVITAGYDLPNEYVIHCLGPVYGQDEPADELLANCYTNALQLAEENRIARIAFPAISTGAFGYPTREAAGVAFRAVKEKAGSLNTVSLVRFVLWGEEAMETHKEVMADIFYG